MAVAAPTEEGPRTALYLAMGADIRLTRADMSVMATHQKRLHGTFFSLSVAPLPHTQRSAFTCVVSKQVAAKATLRNLIKRRCREVARACLKGFSSERPLGLVFRAKSSAARATFVDIERDIQSLVDKISTTGYNLPQ